jgi:hypothetical protein
MPDRTFSLSGGPLAYQVTLDGHDVSKAFRRVVIDVGASTRAVDNPQVTAELAITAIEVTDLGVKDSQFVVTMGDEAREALIALGWAPPREIPMDRREQAREWITDFMATTDDDRVNCVALLLMAADDALECAMEHKREPLGYTVVQPVKGRGVNLPTGTDELLERDDAVALQRSLAERDPHSLAAAWVVGKVFPLSRQEQADV